MSRSECLAAECGRPPGKPPMHVAQLELETGANRSHEEDAQCKLESHLGELVFAHLS